MYLFPNTSTQNRKTRKLGALHWVKVGILICVTLILTWYGKAYKPKPSISRLHDLSIWIVPHKNGLGALAALPDDDIDTNNINTGFRLWLSPPDSLLRLESKGIRYKGDIAVIGDSVSGKKREDILSSLDSGNTLLWLGPLSKEYSGEDVSLKLSLINNSPKDYILDLIYKGHKIRFWGSQTALDSSSVEFLSVGVIMFNFSDEKPFKNIEQAQVLIWKGKCDSCENSRISLDYPESMALVFFTEKRGMEAKRLHFKDWSPDFD